MQPDRLDELVAQLAKCHAPLKLDDLEARWIVEHFDEVREWIENERSIVVLQAELAKARELRDQLQAAVDEKVRIIPSRDGRVAYVLTPRGALQLGAKLASLPAPTTEEAMDTQPENLTRENLDEQLAVDRARMIPPDFCGDNVLPVGSQGVCTRPAGHTGAHRCVGADVDLREDDPKAWAADVPHEASRTRQKIMNWSIPLSDGSTGLAMPPDADVFHVEAVGDRVILAATVSYYQDLEATRWVDELRTFLLVPDGAFLPSGQFPAEEFAKRYLGSVQNADHCTHVWQVAPRASGVELSLEERVAELERALARVLDAVPSAGRPRA